jgi:hypothetical protein
MRLASRLDKIAAILAANQSLRQEIVKRIIEGVDDPDEVLDRMIANIAEHQRGDMRFVRRVIVAPVWDIQPDGRARLVGRRNVHTGEIAQVEGWGDRSDPSREGV